jgi:hypothetical protein
MEEINLSNNELNRTKEPQDVSIMGILIEA